MKMPTNFTVVPVKDGRKSREDDDEDDNNVFREEDEDAPFPGERRILGAFALNTTHPLHPAREMSTFTSMG